MNEIKKYEIEEENKNLGEWYDQKKQKTHRRNLRTLKLNRKIRKKNKLKELL